MPAPDSDRAGADLALLVRAAEGAGAIAAAHFGRAPRSWDKGGGEGPVSEADLAVNDYLRSVLRPARPAYGWLSEEDSTRADTGRLAAEATFVVDPIDGTRAFIDGQKSFAHAIAVVRGGQPVAAVVHLPLMGLTYTALAGRGARLNGRPIGASARPALEGARVLAARVALEPGQWPGGLPPIERHFRPSLAWRLALVGEGAFDAMVTLREAWDWDIAAAALIAAEAGARITDRDGAPLAFNSPQARSPGVLAAPEPLHGALLAARGLMPAPPPPPDPLMQTRSRS